MKRYIIAIYLRLSKEDDRWRGENNRIKVLVYDEQHIEILWRKTKREGVLQ